MRIPCGAGHFCLYTGGHYRPRGEKRGSVGAQLSCLTNAGGTAAAKLDNFLDNLIDSLLHKDLLPRSCGDHRIGCRLDELDQIGTDDNRFTVESCQLNHDSPVRKNGRRPCGRRPQYVSYLPLQVDNFLQELVACGNDPRIGLEPALRHNHLGEFIGKVNVGLFQSA